MTQNESPNSQRLPFFVSLIGALVGGAIFYGITMDIALAVIIGSPIGLLVGLIAYRAIPRIMHQTDSPDAQLNGAAPAPPTIEEQAKPSFRMKTRR